MKEKMKQEAIERMEMLGISPTAIKIFEEDGEVGLSVSPAFPICEITPEYKKLIDKWEEKTGSMAYHAIYNGAAVGALLSILFVSSDEEEWELDKRDMEAGYPMAYVFNLNIPEFSEYGSISVKNVDGILERIG